MASWAGGWLPSRMTICAPLARSSLASKNRRRSRSVIDEEHIVERIAARRRDRNTSGDVEEMRERLGLAPLIPAPGGNITPVSSADESEAPTAGVDMATEQAQEDERPRDQLGGPCLVNFTSKHKFARLHLVGGCYRRPGFELKDCS